MLGRKADYRPQPKTLEEGNLESALVASATDLWTRRRRAAIHAWLDYGEARRHLDQAGRGRLGCHDSEERGASRCAAVNTARAGVDGLLTAESEQRRRRGMLPPCDVYYRLFASVQAIVAKVARSTLSKPQNTIYQKYHVPLNLRLVRPLSSTFTFNPVAKLNTPHRAVPRPTPLSSLSLRPRPRLRYRTRLCDTARSAGAQSVWSSGVARTNISVKQPSFGP